jgi:hypothetical protein
LYSTDKVVLEATINTWEVVAILKPFVTEVVVSNPFKTKALAGGLYPGGTPGEFCLVARGPARPHGRS